MLPRMQLEILLDSGRAVRALLAEMQGEDELFASANTLARVEDHLLVMAQALVHLPPDLRRRLTRVDWHGWRALHGALTRDQRPRREEIWYGICALLPATLHLLDQLRRREPAWFEIGYRRAT